MLSEMRYYISLTASDINASGLLLIIRNGPLWSQASCFAICFYD